MLLMKKTNRFSRLELRIWRGGVYTLRLRPTEFGGYQVAEHINVPWPWRR